LNSLGSQNDECRRYGQSKGKVHVEAEEARYTLPAKWSLLHKAVLLIDQVSKAYTSLSAFARMAGFCELDGLSEAVRSNLSPSAIWFSSSTWVRRILLVVQA